MKIYESKNSKAKWDYQNWLKDAEGFSESTITSKLRAVKLYENIFGGDDFANFNPEKAIRFKDYLVKRTIKGVPISLTSRRTYLINLKMFFKWLGMQPGYRARINRNSLEYLNPSRKDSAIAVAKPIRDYPDKNYICKLVNSIEGDSEIAKRDRALIAFTFLTGMRDKAIITLPLRCVNLEKMYVIQDPKKGVHTKFSKTIYSKIFNFDDKLLGYVTDWINYLKEKGYTPDKPVFPKSKPVLLGNNLSFQSPTGVIPEFWKSSTGIRDIFKKYAEKAKLDYFPPHTFRHTAIESALKLAQNGEEVKAISQNFGHENVATTFSIYGQYDPGDLINQLQKISQRQSNLNENLNKEKVLDLVRKSLEEYGY